MLLQTHVSPRSIATLSRGLPRTGLGACPCASYTTSKPTVSKAPVPSRKTSTPTLFRRPSPSIARGSIRLASTDASAAATAGGAPPPNAAAEPAALTWDRFLTLRKTRRRISLVASVVCAGISTSAGMGFLSTADWDQLQQYMFGMDPILVLGLSTAGFSFAGWLVGPFFGNAVFKLYYRKLGKQIAAKEKEFYARIKKYRVDPSSSSIANPVPDFYGEKIGSVKDYRRWLKDQRAFNLKRGRML